jgi:uncharacterized OB-fold protein
MTTAEAKTPEPVQGFYDKPMWASIAAGAMQLQCCKRCGAWLYPPGPACPKCLSHELKWTPVSGKGTLASWVVFHRHYLPAYPPPYNAIAVRLAEGPAMISNLEGAMPEDGCIGRALRLVYVTMPDGMALSRWRYED